MNKFNKIVLGGTFDHFHIGHKKLIDKAFELGEGITIGIATEKLLKKKILNREIEDFQTRKNSVMAYLKEKKYIDISKLIELNDIFGTAKTEKNIDAIIVSEETKANAEKINKWRTANGFSEMKLIEVEMVRGNDNQIVSSERIRLGEIDREGASYSNLFKNDLILPESLKEELRRPIGIIFSNTQELVQSINRLNNIILIAVGDIVNQELTNNYVKVDLKIIDFKTRRRIINDSSLKSVINKAGTINAETVRNLNKTIRRLLRSELSGTRNDKSNWFIINGEEDLLALPAILLAPLNSIVMYGQYEVGVVVIKVTEKMKKKIKDLINKFQ